MSLYKRDDTFGGFIKGILREVRCTKSLRVLFLHRRPPSWTTLVLYSRAVFFFNEPASWLPMTDFLFRAVLGRLSVIVFLSQPIGWCKHKKRENTINLSCTYLHHLSGLPFKNREPTLHPSVSPLPPAGLPVQKMQNMMVSSWSLRKFIS